MTAQARDVRPLDVLAVEDAVYVPRHACLYDLSGQRIDATMHLLNGRPLRRVTPKVEVPRDLEEIVKPVVYGGHLPKHFGHFLLESLSRLWAYGSLDLGSLPFVHNRTVFHVHERELLEAALGRHGAPLHALTRPTLLRSVLVPEQAIELGRDYHPAMRDVYDTIRTALIGPIGTPDDTPVYLSRTELPRRNRATLGEHALQARLSRRGLRIVHPEQLSLEEQIQTVSHARDVVGLVGTALHLTVFRDLEGARTLALSNRSPEIHQQRVDDLRGSQYVHLHAQFPIHPRMPGVFGGRSLAIGRYRSFLIPALAERAVVRHLET